MMLFLRSKASERPTYYPMKSIGFALVIALLTPIFLFAEGSKDFRDYPGKRLWLDTRDDQQLKVYASEGEFINVGASHTGRAGGFIMVISPDGQDTILFDNTGSTLGLGVINNDVEEINGPTGGGTTMGAGYQPGVIPVGAGEGGIWTVLMDFPDYAVTNFDTLLNNEPWTRNGSQTLSVRVILAWDITVTQGGAGNTGGSPVEGRVFSNEYISILNKNNNLTSPTFYVLSRDGFQYQVDFLDADPFRFPISSNSRGLVESDGSSNTSIYRSLEEDDFERSDDPSTWINGGFYLYEPQAQDFGNLFNHKIFFNLPDPTMPNQALTTDVYRENTHQTWLFNPLTFLQIDSIYFFGANPGGEPCNTPFYEFGSGGGFVIESNIGGEIFFQLDLDMNGSYDDSIDRTFFVDGNGGSDTIFWDGLNGLGDPFASIGDTFMLNYQGSIRFGEIHIANTDVENNLGGVTFDLLNAPSGFPSDIFYYDHSELTGIPEAISGGGTSGDALPTTIPFTYGDSDAFITNTNFGNNRYLDQWVFNDFDLPETTIELIIVDECDCQEPETPVLDIIAADTINACIGGMATLSAVETNPADLGQITYTWQGPNGFFFTETLADGETTTVDITIIDATNAGDYTVTAVTDNGCASEPVSATINVAPNPEISTLLPLYEVCEGGDLFITADVSNILVGTFSYTITEPGFSSGGTLPAGTQIIELIQNVQLDGAGTYNLTVISDVGCETSVNFDIVVNANPVISNLTGGGGYCEGQDVTLSGENTATGMDEITFTWSGPNGFFVQNTTTDIAGPFTADITGVQGTDAGEYVLCLTTDDNCGPVCDTVEVVVNDGLEIINIAGGGNQCTGQDFTLTAENSVVGGVSSVTYTWTLPDGSMVTNVAPPVGPFDLVVTNPNESNTGIYTLTLVADNGCTSEPGTVEVTMNPTIAIADITPDTTICGNDTLFLFATNTSDVDFDYTWNGPNGYTSTGTATAGEIFTEVVFPVQNFGEGEYILTTDPALCSPAPITVNVDTSPTPVLTEIDGSGTFCVGDTVVLSIVNTTPGIDSLFYTCILPDGSFEVQLITDGSPFVITYNGVTLDDAGIISCSAETPDNCGSSLQVTELIVQATPVISDISPDTAVCANENLTLTASNNETGSGNVTYTWTGPNAFSFTGTAPFAGPFPLDLPNIQVDQSGEYCLNLTSDGGCVADEMCTTVTVNATPELVELTGGGEYCEGDDVTLVTMNTVVGTGDLTFTCTDPNGNVITGTIGEGEDIELVLENITQDDAGTYTCVVTTAEGCESNEVSATITVNATPTISDIDGGSPYCEGETITLTANNVVPNVGEINYTWTGPNSFEFTGTAGNNGPFVATIPNAAVTDSGEYCLNIESAAGCGGMEMCVDVIVNPNPIVENFTGGGQFCEGETATLSGSIDLNGATSVDWTLQGPALDESGTSTMNEVISFDLTASEDSEGTYTLTLTTDQGCTATATQTITVIQVSVPQLSAAPNPVCPGDELVLTVDNPGEPGTVYEWFENGTLLGTSTDPNFTVTTAVGGNYAVTTTLEGCDEESAEVNVPVVTAPIANDDNFETNFETALNGDVTTNDELSNGGVIVTIIDDVTNGILILNEDGTFTYTPDDGFAGGEVFTYEICSALCPNECDEATVIINVMVDCEEIYNVITPNGDEANDEFFVPCLVDDGIVPPAFPTNSIKIFNRWGDVVFDAKPYRNDWEGTNNSEEALPSGTYFYMIELREGGGDGEDNLLVGYVTVVR